ncbi:MAG TPA: UDP-glucose 6-dehydrogenase [Vicinamibacterales bacterium]|nr:UDP-glucose 6-dehydrogenase [Vicinamibacterales bacterium]HOQ59018.1 UDP-glucose 6-dehydrogenase [Vicinamibacterales bacterium]HPK71076.1 UDP-glucose 6-dehydrogenase [Vicinamibacterales bacterium]
MIDTSRILCIGAGYVGGPTMAVVAAKCPHIRVDVVDINEARIAAWNSAELPIYEPGLDEVVRAARGRNLFFSTDIAGGIRDADIIFVSVNTPTKTFGQGAGYAADLQHWEKTARQILAHATRDKIVVEKSTLPVRTAQAMERILDGNPAGVRFDVVSNPEFLAEGSAIADLERPDRVLIGGHDTPAGRAARRIIADIYATWVPRERIIESNLWSAELSKLTANAFLAQRISSINSISALCEVTGADVDEVAYAIGTDSRVGPRFLKASVGFGGSCFKKDILNLVYICRSHGLGEVADYWESVVAINEWQQSRFVRNMLASMFNTVAGKRIALFGFAFKADTGDTRESAAIGVARQLLAERAVVVITDPKALGSVREELPEEGDRIECEIDPYRAARGAHAIAIMTEWRIYRDLDYARIFASMEKPAFVFDGRNILDHKRLHEIGFNVYALGKAPLRHV